MKKIIVLIAVLALTGMARAIELSLEENRGERGSVGYVDMQRLFTASPDAQRAKEGFEDLVRQAEERVNLRKAELLKLHQELDATRVERDALAKSMALAPVPLPVAAPAASTAAPTAATLVPSAALAVSTTPAAPVSLFGGAHPAVAVSSAPAATPVAPAAIPFAAVPAVAASTTAPAVAVSTAAVSPAPRPREMALPGMSTMSSYAPSAPPASTAAAPAVPVKSPATAVASAAQAPATSTAAAASPPAAVAASTKTVQAAQVPAVSTSAVAAAAAMFPLPGPPPAVAQVPAGPSPAQRLLEFDAKIIGIQADIAHKEADLMHEHDDADRGLLDVESRKTDQVLARLYRAVSEVARREGVSVVVDKTTILYGHQAVDLTDKVLKYLRETPATPAAAQ